jgi:hypothetical protein
MKEDFDNQDQRSKCRIDGGLAHWLAFSNSITIDLIT